MSSNKARMDTAVEFLKTEYNTLRTGRAHPAQIEYLSVKAFDSKYPLREVATISVRAPQVLVVNPSEESLVDEVMKTLQAADMNLTPRVEGTFVVVQFPKPSQEARQELIRQAGKKAEQARTVVRGVRNDAVKEIKELVASRDESFRFQKDLQQMHDQAIEQINKLLAAKEKEIASS